MTSNIKLLGNNDSLYGSFIDWLLLGGASVIVFVGLRCLNPTFLEMSYLVTVMFIAALIINNPHFIHSYQLFWALRPIIEESSTSRAFKTKWLLTAYALPLLLILFLTVAVARWQQSDPSVMAAAINLLGVLVGWHYVKQGFGMAMLYAAVKKCYWSGRAKGILLYNSFFCWGAAWALANTGKGIETFWGFHSFNLNLPPIFVWIFCSLAFFSTLCCVVSVLAEIRRWRHEGKTWSELPLNGIFAYGVTLYLWTLFALADVSYLFVIPFFHSLQYMTIVWRYKANEISHQSKSNKSLSLLKFSTLGIIFGLIGFWILPGLIDYLASAKVPYFSDGVFVAFACITIFINIHHYFIDSVIWRKENRLVNQYLFS